MTSAIQLVDYVDEAEYGKIRSELPHVKLVQVVHVEDRSAVSRAQHLSAFVDALLLDSGRPNADVKILGGTGKTHDWNVSGEIVRSVGIPVFLAGGITPENVRGAVESVRPYGIDVCTGVRSGGNLDSKKVEALIREVRETSLA